jgi:hypothetical protein
MMLAIESSWAWKIRLFLSFQKDHQTICVRAIKPLCLILGIMVRVLDSQ